MISHLKTKCPIPITIKLNKTPINELHDLSNAANAGSTAENGSFPENTNAANIISNTTPVTMPYNIDFVPVFVYNPNTYAGNACHKIPVWVFSWKKFVHKTVVKRNG